MQIEILKQPDDCSCGPTCLHAIYKYLGQETPLETVIRDVHCLSRGGTLATLLGTDALRRGFDVTIYSYNLQVFDPSWYKLDCFEMVEKLNLQLEHKKEGPITDATNAYIQFLLEGGKIRFDDLSTTLLKTFFDKQLPVLVGLNSNYLYKTRREVYKSKKKTIYDDVRGEPQGHFVVLYGINEGRMKVADPSKRNHISKTNYYEIDANRIINAIHLGVITHDSNLLVISKLKPDHAKNNSIEFPSVMEV